MGKNNRIGFGKIKMKKTLFSYRLEKLCRGDGGKVGIVINDVVSAFFLNSSLVPGRHRKLFSSSRYT